jgi:hypothetical protein
MPREGALPGSPRRDLTRVSTVPPLSYARKKYDPAGKEAFEDANAWVALSDIFTNILNNPILQSTYLILHDLRNCTCRTLFANCALFPYSTIHGRAGLRPFIVPTFHLISLWIQIQTSDFCTTPRAPPVAHIFYSQNSSTFYKSESYDTAQWRLLPWLSPNSSARAKSWVLSLSASLVVRYVVYHCDSYSEHAFLTSPSANLALTLLHPPSYLADSSRNFTKSLDTTFAMTIPSILTKRSCLTATPSTAT